MKSSALSNCTKTIHVESLTFSIIFYLFEPERSLQAPYLVVEGFQPPQLQDPILFDIRVYLLDVLAKS